MKYLSFFQVISGLAIVISSWVLGMTKAHVYTRVDPVMNGDISVIMVDARPPSAVLELLILGLSIAVFICGWWQWTKNIKLALPQIILGWVIIVVNLILGIRAATSPSGEISGIYYIAYLSLTLGAAVGILGIIQFIYYQIRAGRPGITRC